MNEKIRREVIRNALQTSANDIEKGYWYGRFTEEEHNLLLILGERLAYRDNAWQDRIYRTEGFEGLTRRINILRKAWGFELLEVRA